MDGFSRTFLPAAADAGLAVTAINRHLPILRRCVASEDNTVLATRCVRPGRLFQGEYLLILTHRRLVVIHQSPLLRQLRLHLNTDLRHLSNATWNADPELGRIEIAVTAIDGVRERFLIRANRQRPVWYLDALFDHLFGCRVGKNGGNPAPRRDGQPEAGTAPTGSAGDRRTPKFNPAVAR